MKYNTAIAIALAGTANAIPIFSLPAGFSLPSLGGGFPSLGSFTGLPGLTGFPGLPGATGFPGLPSELPSGIPTVPTDSPTLPSGIGGIPSGITPPALPSGAGSTGIIPTPTASEIAAEPTETASAGKEAVSASCTPQGNGGGDTENGVANKNCCTDLTVIFARGTSETGNVGTVAGPPMFKSLRSKLGANRVTVQGVDYPASIAGNANLGADGGPAMASSVKAALAQCPDTKIILSGYSQGGMVVHNAFSQGVSASQVKGAVLFGDPLKSQKVGDLATSAVKEFCASGDLVCEGGGFAITPAHLTYGQNADEAATFALQAAGLA